MKKLFLLGTLFLALSGTTYILKEGDVEVGRMEETDGKAGVTMIENKSPGDRLGSQAPAAEGGAVIPAKVPAEHPWYAGIRGYQTALGYQKVTKDPVLVYFYTTWCPYCRKFEDKVLKTPRVKTALAGVLKAQLDAELEEAVAAEYDVDAYPRVYVRAADGRTKRVSASQDPDEFLDACRKAGLRLRL